jgi:5-methylcytosine-specific restriction endonuclease McrA
MVEISDRMICTNCQREVNNEFIKPCRVRLKMIKGKSIVDHIIPITPENYEEWDIVWNQDNLRLLCLDHHNKITFKYTKRKYNSKDIFDLDKRGDINLF